MAHNYFLKDLKPREKVTVIRIRSEKLDNDRVRVAIEFQKKKVLPQKYPESTPVTCKRNDSARGGGV